MRPSAKELRKRIEPTVERWEYAMFIRHGLVPFESELARRPRGKKIPRPRKDGYTYGFDGLDRLVLESNNVHEFFYVWGARRVDCHGFERATGAPLPRVEYELSGGRIVRLTRQQRDGGSNSEGYEYDKRGQLVRVRYQGSSRRDGYDQLAYDALGGLVSIVNHAPGGRLFPVWKRLERAQTKRTVLPRVRELLVAGIPRAIAKARVRGEAYCIALAYNSAEELLPPNVAIGVGAPRTWTPEDMWTRVPELDRPTRDACAIANRLLADDPKAGERLLREVAVELDARDWSQQLDTSDDFIVFATDVEQPTAERDARKARARRA